VALAIGAVAVSLVVVILPLSAARYPPMTDLPFHAAFGGTLRHYWDPSYHLKEQFELLPLSRPYMSLYGLIAALMLALPMMAAVKTAVAIHLLLVPAGLAVLFHGANKSPLLGLLGLGMVWGNLTHWGFINYVGAVGLFAMVVGLTLLLLDRPTRGRSAALVLALVALYFTHIFRYPFAIAAVAGTGLVMFPATRRLLPLALPLAAATLLFLAWWRVRPAGEAGGIPLGIHLDRLKNDFGNALTKGFKGDEVKHALFAYFAVAAGVALVCASHAVEARVRGLRRFTAWDIGVTVVPLACAGAFTALFVVLPLFIGEWFYVYPREATIATVMLLGACPDLPSAPASRAALVGAMALAGVNVARQTATQYADFAQTGEDLYAITRHIPRGPRLFYGIEDHTGSTRSTSPFSHLAAYVQAEQGGWLSWSFALWGTVPIAFRKHDDPEAVLIPPYRPSFDPAREPPFFDWMLLRQKPQPTLFAKDPHIELVDHVGMWWLFHRVP
jgi:hypothetical protein